MVTVVLAPDIPAFWLFYTLSRRVMRVKWSVHIVVLLAVFAVAMFFGRPIRGGGSVSTLRPVPEFHDWSTRHVIYSNWGYLGDVDLAASDPRAIFSWRARPVGLYHRFPPFPPIHRPRPRPAPSALHRDWSINLGTAGTAPGMYPAKFSFDVTQTPSCANDFVVFPIAAKGSTGQPNLVAFNNLYSGTTGGTGTCNRTASGSDLGNTATVLWSYNVQGITGGGAVTTSPVISYDSNGTSSGLKVAFVESIAGSPAHFHVLAWKSGDGKNSGNLQSVLTPATITTFTTNAPLAGSGTATDLALGASTSGTDTLSSPFVDYVRDTAYVGNDLGVLYRIKDVFCTSTNPDCAGTTKPAPSLDTTWGTSGAVTVCSGVLTGPVLDFNTLNVYVGCSDGKLYSVSQTGTIKSITVGDGVAAKTYGAIVDPPIVDGINGFVYAVSGSASNGANGALVQAKLDFSSSVTATIGAGNQCNMHAPALNNVYYTSPTTTGALVYVGGTTGVVSQPCSAGSTTTGDIFIYAVTFNGTTGVMTSGAPTSSLNAGGGPGAEWAPLLEFYNATTATDWLFVAALQSSQTNMATVNITSSAFGAFANFVTYGLGPSGMIVDNQANTTTYPQAASIYFNAQGENAACTNNTVLTDTGGCAIKLTQAALQ
jgi:hypothetical protein